MRILIFNWRDIKNPASGGAEVLTHELAKRWVKAGHSVVEFCSQFPKSKKEEDVDGVKMIRRGTWWTVQLFGLFYYMFNADDIDVVIDEVHWFPFFSRIYAGKKTVLLACEVARDLFPKLFPHIIAVFFRKVERIYFSLYKNTITFAISASTRNELIKEGFNPKWIFILPMGLTLPNALQIDEKERDITIAFLGRIHPLKGVEDAISAFSIIEKVSKNAKFWIIGSGEESYLQKMKNKIKNLGLEKKVHLFGYVTQEEKFQLISKSHILLVPSVQEGWGLVVPEAACVGTPSIAYHTAGLKDIINDGVDGITTKKNTPEELAKSVTFLLKNPKLYKIIQKNAMQRGKSYNWDNTANFALKILKDKMKTQVLI